MFILRRGFAYILLLMTVLAFIGGCSRAPRDIQDTPPAVINAAEDEEDDFVITYTATLDIDPEARMAQGILKVRFKNKTAGAAHEAFFSLNLNAFRRGVRPKPYLTEAEARIFEHGLDFGYIDIQNVTMNREPLNYQTYSATLRVFLPEPLPPSEETEIMLQFEAYIPMINHRTGANGDAVWFGSFLPQLCVFDGNGWHTNVYYPVGSPFYSDIANYNITVNTPPGYTISATGVEEVSAADDIQETTVNVRLVRDFAFAISSRYTRTTHIAESGTELNFYAYSPGIDAEPYLAAAEDALEYYGALISSYPYRQLDIAEAGLFGEICIAYPQLIYMDTAVLAGGGGTDSLPELIAGQWFGNIAGADQIREPYLNEGLTGFLGCLYRIPRGGLDEYMREEYDRLSRILPDMPHKNMTADLGAFATAEEYEAVHITRAILMFYSLYTLMGEDVFGGFLSVYFNRFAYGIASGDGLVDTASECLGEDLTEFFVSWIYMDVLPPIV